MIMSFLRIFPLSLAALLPLSGQDEMKHAKAEALLVSPEELVPAWTSYAAMREVQGVPMKVISLKEVAENYEGVDLAEKLRVCFRQHVDEHQFTTLILGGDSAPTDGLVPDRDTLHDNMWGTDADIPSDVYFLSASSWDADGDGVFGEFEEDKEEISYPDGSLAIGRIPVRTIEDVEAYQSKVARHLSAQPCAKLTMTCAVRGARKKVSKGGKTMIEPLWEGGSVTLAYEDLTNGFLGKQFEGLETNKWHIHGHGLLDQWQLDGRETFEVAHAMKLKNKNRPLVMTTVSCFTGHFDAEEDPCITEAMLRAPDGGAVLIVSPAREGKPHFHNPKEDFQLMVHEGKLDGTTQTMTSFWMASLGPQKKTAGFALAQAKADLAKDATQSATYHQGMCELNLFGDPTLPVQ